ncbi:MAG: hypothetical protein HC815_26000 [Richelia sp. RM1_1_1]|nr:hypothetical protein [Richelia sp. RM1_1_1]
MSPIIEYHGGDVLSKNGNGHQGLWNPVKIFIRLVQGVWKNEMKYSEKHTLLIRKF